MKKMIKTIYMLLILAVAVSGCKKEDPITPEQEMMNKLSGTWKVSAGVFVDGENITAQYNGFTISFNNDINFKVYDVTNGGEAFKQETDSYEFIDSGYSLLKRKSDGTVMTVSFPSAQNMNITFSILPETTGGRVEGTYGEFVFNLTRN